MRNIDAPMEHGSVGSASSFRIFEYLYRLSGRGELRSSFFVMVGGTFISRGPRHKFMFNHFVHSFEHFVTQIRPAAAGTTIMILRFERSIVRGTAPK